MVFGIAIILVAATTGFEQPQATAATIALSGVIFLGLAILLAAAEYVSPFFPNFGFGFCYIGVPAALISALICVFTGHLGAALGLGIWAAELIVCYFILRELGPRMFRRDRTA